MSELYQSSNTTVDLQQLYNTRPHSTSLLTQLTNYTTVKNPAGKYTSYLFSFQNTTLQFTSKVSLIYHTAVFIVMLPSRVVLL
jgi:hypothetical protein